VKIASKIRKQSGRKSDVKGAKSSLFLFNINVVASNVSGGILNL
jgi:hypothetical protein